MFDTRIPSEWIKAKLPEIAILNMGQSPSNYDVNEIGKGIAFFQGKAEFGKIYPTVRKFCTAPKKVAQVNDILLSVRAPVGPTNLADRETAIGRGLAAISVSKDNFNYKYLLHYFRSIEPWMSKQGTGTTFKAISGQFLKELCCIVPPLAEQKIIADKLDILLAQVDATKAHLECIPRILKNFRQSVLTNAVSGKLTEDWRDVDIAQWKKLKLLDVIKGKPRNGHSPKGVGYETPYRNLTLSATTSGHFIENQYKYVDLDIDSDSYLWVKRGDILIQRANTIGYVGVSAIYEGEDNQYVYPDLMMKCTPDPKKILGKFLHLVLSSKKVRQYFRDNATGTSGNMPKINQQAVSNAPIYLPPLNEQHEIVRRAECFFAFADRIEQQVNDALEQINSLTQSILAKAFRGELTVDWRANNQKLISGENSAKALLTKIKAEREAINKQPKLKRSAIENKTDGLMSKKIINVVEALKQAGEPLSGQQLLAAAGYPSDSNTEQLEQFFLDIRYALTIEKSIVKKGRDDDSQDWFSLAQDGQQ